MMIRVCSSLLVSHCYMNVIFLDRIVEIMSKQCSMSKTPNDLGISRFCSFTQAQSNRHTKAWLGGKW